MTRSIHRKSLASRLLSVGIVFAILFSFSGIGYATPGAGHKAAPSTESSTTPTADPKIEAPPTVEVPVVAPPAEEPAVTAVTPADPKVDPKIADKAAAPVYTPKAPTPGSTGVGVSPEAPMSIITPTCTVNKTFKLFMDNVPAGTTFFVKYRVGETTRTLNLSGSNPAKATVALNYGTVIKWVEWYGRTPSGDTLLHLDDEDECLTSDRVNTFTYESFLAGRKFRDVNANSKYDAGEPYLSGWTIELRRASDDSVYATRVTGPDGCYSFRDVYPGEYYVAEVMQDGWHQTHAPSGTVQVKHGTCVEGLCFGNVEVLSGIDVTKSGDSSARVGDTVNYTITVTNSGGTKLVNVKVDDPMFGGVIATIPQLLPGASQTYDLSHVVTDTDADPLDNTVTASGIDLCGKMVVDTAKWSCDIVHPSITLDKSVSPGIVLAGGSVMYSYDIENTGDVILYGVSLDDDVLGSLDAYLPATTLNVGEKWHIEVPYTVIDDVKNTATVVAMDSWETKCSASDDAFVDARQPGISIVKSATPEMVYAGEVVTYTYLITNTGDTPLWGITLDDTVLGDLSYILPQTMLPAGGSMTAQISVPVQADVTNVGIVDAYYGEIGSEFFGGPITASSEALVDVIAPSLAVRKTASPDVVLAGEWVLYSYEVENTGDVPLVKLSLFDIPLGPVALDKSAIGPGEIARGTMYVPINVDTSNLAIAGAIDPLGRFVEGSAKEFVDVVAPAVELDKTVSQSVIAFGGEVEYSYAVHNSGDVALYDLDVFDSVIGNIGTIPYLEVGQTITLGPVPWNITADTYNIGSVMGIDQWGHPVRATDDATVDVRNPAITLSKTADPTVIHAGDMVTYTYLITNTGDTDLSDIALDDDVLGDLAYLLPSLDLAAGASTTAQITVPVDSDVTNIGTVLATYGEPDSAFGGEVKAQSTASVDVIHPDMLVRKTADKTVILEGELVTYSYEIENTGDVPLDAIQLTDDQLGPITLDKTTLEPGETAYGSASAAIEEDTLNVATATAVDPLQMTLQRTADASVDVIHPAIEVYKSVNPDIVVYEGEVTYDYYVVNSGDVALSSIDITDDQLGTIALDQELAAGASASFSRTAVIDVDTTNRVDVIGYDAYQHEVTAWATADVDVIHPAVGIVKTVEPGTILAGEEVTYTYVVSNTGDVTLEDLAVVDDQLGAVGSRSLLAPADTWTFQVTSAIDDDTINVATVTGTYRAYANEEASVTGTVTDSDDAVVDVVAPAIDVEKTADKDFVIEPGEDVAYTYTVTNTGDVPLFGVVLDDDVLGTVGAAGMLDVGESMQFEATTFIDADVTNIVTATADDQWGHEVSDSAEWSVVFQPFAPLPPDMAITKSANKTTADPGELVTYTLTYTNTEDPAVAPNAIATDFSIEDDFDGRYATVVNAGGGTLSGGKLSWNIAGPVAPGESGTVSYTMRINADMPSGTTNVDNVVVIRLTGDPNPDNDSDEARVRVSTDVATSEEEPFLPFTGGDVAIFVLAVIASAAVGGSLRRYASRAA